MARNFRPFAKLNDAFGWSNADNYNLDWLIQEQLNMREFITAFREDVEPFITWANEMLNRFFPKDFEEIRTNPTLPVEIIRHEGRYIEITYDYNMDTVDTKRYPVLIVDQPTEYPVIRPVVMFKEDKATHGLTAYAEWIDNTIYLSFRMLPNGGTSSVARGKYKIVLQF